MNDARDFHAAIGGRIRRGRLASRMTLDGLSEKSGLSRGFLSDLENGKRGLSVLSLLKIASAIDVRPQWFLKDVSP